MSAYAEQQLEAIRAHLEKVERRLQLRERQDVPVYSFHTGKTDANGIAAQVGDTPGSGTVTLYHLVSGTWTARTDQLGTEVTVTAYNQYDAAVGVTTSVQIQQDTDGTYWVSGEQC